MIRQPHIIFFCYAYIIGLVLAMVLPVNPAFLPVLQIAVLVSLLVFGVVLWRNRAAPDAAPWFRSLWLWTLVAAMPLGYSRYLSANTVPDTMIGEIRMSTGRSEFLRRGDLPDTCRIRVHKSQALAEDVHVRFVGELDARVPDRDAQGRATLDTQGRWRFRIAPMSITSDVVVVRASDPVGTDVTVAQPFTRLTGVEVVRGPQSGVVSVYRISNHIGSFVRPGRAQSPVTILGAVSADPLVYDFKTVLPVTPDYIQYPAGGPFYRVEGGEIQVTIRPTMTGYERFASTEGYGLSVEFSGELTVARAAANPGGFNARRFMQNYNIFGLMSLYEPRGGPAPIHVIARPDGSLRHGNPLVNFSLALRDDVLRVIKQTILFPQSAFIGGVTLGLRYGLAGVECMFSDRYDHYWDRFLAPGHEPCEETIADEFKEAGVNHVLAVSGLHVTIITVMFVGIFSMMRLPRQAYVPLIILSLVVFAIITGARPSTLRAVIMNSLFLMTWAYLHQGLRSSVLLGVPVAAFLILLHNPLVVVDPSFTLSFGAILSLALLTTPSLDLLQRLRGNLFALFILVSTAATVIAVMHWPLFVTPQFLLPASGIVAALALLARELQRRGIGIPEKFNYALIPEGAGGFFAAQFAIQLGMMIPLSAFYFSRWPFAGAYANLIAIPLIGVNVQLGAIGGLLGLIPGVGIWIALLMGAANWIFSSVFLWLAHVSALVFPYPFVRRPGILFVAVYYVACAWFIWRAPIRVWLNGALARWNAPPWAYRAVVAAAAAAIGLGLYWDVRTPGGDGETRVHVLSVGYGSGILVESPGGRRVLVDSGFIQHDFGRRNEATRTLIPYLAHRGIRHVDALVLLSPRPERIAGAGHLLEHLWIDRLFTPTTMTNLAPTMTYEEFVARFSDPEDAIEAATLSRSYEELIGNDQWPRRASLAKALAKRGDTWVNRWAGWTIEPGTLQAGQVLFEENHPSGRFAIEVLGPAPGSASERSFDDGSLVLRVTHGAFALLLTGDLRHDAVADLVARTPAARLRADIVVLPHRGTAPAGLYGAPKEGVQSALRRGLGELLDRSGAEHVIAEYGNPRPVLGDLHRDAAQLHELTKRFVEDRVGPDAWLSTDTDLAIFIRSDGAGYTLETQAEANRAEGGVEDAVSDIAVGL